jgi:hypothetical protein
VDQFLFFCSIATAPTHKKKHLSRTPERMAAPAQALSSAAGAQPRMIYGTAWKKKRTTDLVHRTVSLGFRGIDTACHYWVRDADRDLFL